MKSIPWMTAVICLGVSLCVTGCWDGVELQRRAIVMMIGIDPAGSTEDNRLRAVNVTLQLVRLHRVGNGASGSSGGASDRSPVITVSEQGRDIGEALRKIQLSIDRTLFYGHLQAVVINRRLAEQGMLSILNPLVQSRVVSRNLWVFVSDPPAAQSLQRTPALDVIPAMYLANLFRNRVWVNRPYDGTIGGFHQRLATPGVEPYAFMITRMDPNLSAPYLDGLAAFSGDRLAGFMDRTRFTGWAIVENQLPESNLAFSCSEDPARQFILDVKSVRSRIRVLNLNGPKPYVDVRVWVRGSIEGGACVTQETDDQLQQLKGQVEAQLTSIVKDAIHWSQVRTHADIFGIGREVYRHQPDKWRGDQWWSRMFERLDVRVHVQARIDFMQTYHRSELVYQRS